MKIEKVKALAELLESTSLSAIEVGEGKSRIRVERTLGAATIQAQPTSASTIIPETATTVTDEISDVPNNVVNLSEVIEVKSPLVGVYYSAPSPDAEPFVSIGSKVKKGDVICIIETMKLMNEIVAENEGEIIDICLKNGDVVDFGQVMFKLK